MPESIKEYPGRELTVSYDVKRCIHAAECTRGLPAVFDVNARPWVNPDAASPEKLAEVIARCPSGALHLVFKDGRASEAVPAVNRATVSADGPLYLHGNIEILDGDGSMLLRDTRVALCRCGASRNKPYCDNSHKQIGFRDPGMFQTDHATDAGGGLLKVTRRNNGPLYVQGPLELCCADGRTGSRGAEYWLCRCGGSQNKPFCDGTHKKTGFIG
jgi:CDGSH-type Zn-finger protein/uncharacterized Fe-S cluster protein YjdI